MIQIINLILVLTSLINFVVSWPDFELYTKHNRDEFILVNSSSNLNETFFNFNLDTKFIIHGFSSDSSKMVKIKDKLLDSHDLNVIMVNWKEGSQAPDYFRAAVNTRIVGKRIASLISASNIQISSVHCIGHSLGAHICGFAGKIRRLGRISGLDPAGPLFKGQPYLNRLDKLDADFVDIIHTDVTLGIQDAIGHLDFYPNGGELQTGCIFRSSDLVNLDKSSEKIVKLRLEPSGRKMSYLSCSHTRSHQLYAQSISKCNFKSTACTSYDEFKEGKCSNSSCSILTGCPKMGYNSHKFYKHGKYYLDTTGEEPFCLFSVSI